VFSPGTALAYRFASRSYDWFGFVGQINLAPHGLVVMRQGIFTALVAFINRFGQMNVAVVNKHAQKGCTASAPGVIGDAAMTLPEGFLVCDGKPAAENPSLTRIACAKVEVPNFQSQTISSWRMGSTVASQLITSMCSAASSTWTDCDGATRVAVDSLSCFFSPGYRAEAALHVAFQPAECQLLGCQGPGTMGPPPGPMGPPPGP
jgi:hypothetical protein